MIWRDTIIHSGGYWQGLDYIGGELESFSLPLDDQCYDYLLKTVQKIVPPIQNDWDLLLHTICDCGGKLMKKQINHVVDLHSIFSRISEADSLHVFVVTMKKLSFGFGATRNSQAAVDGVKLNTGGFVHSNFCNNVEVDVPPTPCEENAQFDEANLIPTTSARDSEQSGINGHQSVGCGDDLEHINIAIDNDMVVHDDATHLEVKNCVFEVLEKWSRRFSIPEDTSNTKRGSKDVPPNYGGSTSRWIIPGTPRFYADDPDEPDDHEELLRNPQLVVGKSYMSKKRLLSAVGEYRLENQGGYKVKYSDTSRYKLICTIPNCPFQIGASANAKCDFWIVYKVVGHACATYPHNDHPELPSKVVAAHLPSSTCDVHDEVNSVIRPRTAKTLAGLVASSSIRKRKLCSRCGGNGHNRVTCGVYMEISEVEPLPEMSEKKKRRAPRKCSICKSQDHLKNKCPHNLLPAASVSQDV